MENYLSNDKNSNINIPNSSAPVENPFIQNIKLSKLQILKVNFLLKNELNFI